MWFLLFFCLWFVTGVWANEPAEAPGKKPVATVAGQPIYEEDLMPHIQSQMLQIRNQEYQIKSQALEGVINQRLVEAEAKARDLSVEELLDREVNSKIADPTDAEVEAVYLAQKDRINRPLEEVKVQLRQAIHQSKLQQVREDFFQSLRAEAEVAAYLSPPRIEMDHDPERVLGNPDAPITIVEFSDFQCPFCERAYSVVKEVLNQYEGQVKLAYRDFPLRQMHPQAQAAAEASRCAGEQGQFWEYHDLLFENFNQFDTKSLIGHARDLGLDSPQFEGCLSSGKYLAQIEEDIQDGVEAGVSGTPAFFINGILVSGAQPASAFAKVIEAELARSQKQAQ